MPFAKRKEPYYFNRINLRVESYGGDCPVQMEGFIGKRPFYLRGRGEITSLEVFANKPFGETIFYYDAVTHLGTGFGAGYQTDEEVLAFLEEALKHYRLENISP